MIKFMVVIHKRRDMSVAEFQRYFREVHGPLAEAIPGLLGYRQNHVAPDPKREPPDWHGIAELTFAGREEMEAAWDSAEGQAATDDLELFVDLERTRWSVVDELVIR